MHYTINKIMCIPSEPREATCMKKILEMEGITISYGYQMTTLHLQQHRFDD